MQEKNGESVFFLLSLFTLLVKDKVFHEGKKSTEFLVNKMRLFCLSGGRRERSVRRDLGVWPVICLSFI